MKMCNASLKTTKQWKDINWAKVQRKVFKLQKRIFNAAKSGQKAKAHKLQKLLLKSQSAKLLAVRKVTQDNQGKKTAGIDGKKVLYDYQRIQLAQELNILGYKTKALLRIWIPKPGKDEKRPLGIPTIKDRAMQALVKLTLEPYWEALFEATSYGFRPGRSAHDAIEQIFNKVRRTEKYVLDADINKCFDKINHEYLLNKLECPKETRKLIKQWLKAGVMDNGVFEETNNGTPQGGVISPLLANIALDGMIRDIENSFPNSSCINGVRKQGYRPKVVRYADDFVVIHTELEVILKCKELISKWLEKVGLVLKPEKTRICNTLREIKLNGEIVKPGFDFLGFNIRSYPVGKYKTGKTGGRANRPIGFKTIIRPCDKATHTHREKLKEIVKRHRTAPQSALIHALNPVIRGWSNYYKTVASSETFQEIDNEVWLMLRAWTSNRTGKANLEKLRKYFSSGKHGAWTFQTEKGECILKHSKFHMKRHASVQGERSPYDGDWVYWSKRRGQYAKTPLRVAKLLKEQNGYCNHCKQSFMPDDIVEIDHIIPTSQGGLDEYDNLQLLHRHCHDTKTRTDIKKYSKS